MLYRVRKVKMSEDSLLEIMQDGRQWSNIFIVEKTKNKSVNLKLYT